MRLIDTATGILREFANDNEVKYAILSHRWEDEEVSLQEFVSVTRTAKRGFVKIQNACKEALKIDLPYLWVDTCCIDKSSSAELSEAINSMYRWYSQAEICFAYLSDVDTIEDLAASKWFIRGWTLQELVASKTIKFYNKNWRPLGSKAGLQVRLSSITKIPVKILRGEKLTQCSIAQRMSWAADRITTRPEDMAYCLMGLFEVNMPMLYGEGLRAFTRLQEEIIKASDDQSIFAWSDNGPGRKGILAPSPACFRDCGSLRSTANASAPLHYSMTNVGLSINLPLIPWTMNTYLAVLQCTDVSNFKELMPQHRPDARSARKGIFIRTTGRVRQYVRVSLDGEDVYHITLSENQKDLTPMALFLLRYTEAYNDTSHVYGFIFRNITSALFPHAVRNRGNCPAIRSRRPPIKGEWTSGRYHDLRTWRADANPAYQILSDAQTVTLVENPRGKQGSIAILYAGCDARGDPETLLQPWCLACITFGFDFYFNPVCVLRRIPTTQWRGCPLHGTHSCGGTVPNSKSDGEMDKEFHDCQYLEELLQRSTAFPKHNWDGNGSWDREGLIAFRGHRDHGLEAVCDPLNVRINVQGGWKDKFTKAWIVDITAIDLPGELQDEDDYVKRRKILRCD